MSKLVQFVNKTAAPLSSPCTFTSFGVHENVKLQPTTIARDIHILRTSNAGALGVSAKKKISVNPDNVYVFYSFPYLEFPKSPQNSYLLLLLNRFKSNASYYTVIFRFGRDYDLLMV